MEEEDRLSEISDAGCSQFGGDVLYTVDQINVFLDETKGRSVEVRDFFPDLEKFVCSVLRVQKNVGTAIQALELDIARIYDLLINQSASGLQTDLASKQKELAAILHEKAKGAFVSSGSLLLCQLDQGRSQALDVALSFEEVTEVVFSAELWSGPRNRWTADLKGALDTLIHIDQSYCVPKRSIYDNLFLIRDMMDFAGLSGTEFGLLSLDQEKAFDRVDHEYLFNTMRHFGFGEGFLSWVRLLYTDASCLIKVGGGLSLPVPVRRGIRQGCPLSGQLYAIAVEPLLCLLRTRLVGMQFAGSSVRLFAYADDVTVVIHNSEDVDALKASLSIYERASFARLNWGKTKAVWCGPRAGGRPLPPLPGAVEWDRKGFKVLGVWLGTEDVEIKNWEGLVEKVRARLSRWSWLLPQLSYRGRVLIANNLIASALWHKFTVLNPPRGLIKDIQKALVDFFWSGQHWLRAAVLYLPVQEGGQGLIDIRSRVAVLRLQAAQRFLYRGHHPWIDVACALLLFVNLTIR
ncbi:hypothetical protein NFI96_017176, partial [Prochilodus magdalenae]